jgi:hypothetical protein
MSWIQRTYAVGTPVKFVKGTPVPWSNEVIPAGARGVVVGHQFDLDADDYLHIARILVEIADARYRDGSVIDDLVGRVTTVDAIYFAVMSEDILAWLTPLQDNWAQASAPLKHHQLPRSQRRSSRRTLGYDPEPNPEYQSYRCPSCGGVSHPATGTIPPRPNGKKRRSSRSTETQELIDKAREAGWRIEYTQGNHVRLYPPDSSKPAVGATLSRVDPRAWLNFRAALRRSGLDVNRRTSRRR